MNSPKIAIAVVWVAFWAYWVVSARRSKRGTRSTEGFALRGLLMVAGVLLFGPRAPQRA